MTDWKCERGDCCQRMAEIPESLRPTLIVADPPFNIGYEYDEYDDNKSAAEYIEWSRGWLSAAYANSTSNASLWVCIGDAYAAELKVLAEAVGWKLRQWCLWHFTFGVNAKRLFTPSHTHMLYFVKGKDFVFLESLPENRIPSSRLLIYGDKRANPDGRLPNDVWIFPRVAGTFSERAGFHGCQMPESVLARIVRACSRPGDVVLDPFCGSGTTIAVAKKLGRAGITFDISENYIAGASSRLAGVAVGDPISGDEDDMVAVPRAWLERRLKKESIE